MILKLETYLMAPQVYHDWPPYYVNHDLYMKDADNNFRDDQQNLLLLINAWVFRGLKAS